MGNPQKYKFRDVEEFMESLPEDERRLVKLLRQLVLDCIPEAIEKLAYNVPFYYRHSRICFIWPASVPWGGVREGVALGFCKGTMLSTAKPGQTGQVTSHTFTKLHEINAEALRQQLYEAILLDEEEHREKHLKKKTKAK